MVREYQLVAIAAVCWLGMASALHAQSCVGNGVFTGSYAFVGSRNVFASAAVTPPGTNGSSGTASKSARREQASDNTGTTFSNTPIGQLIGGVLGTSPFNAVGRVVADGAGSLLASSSPNGSLTAVGSYTVNQDCSVSLTLNDAFISLPATPPGTSGSGGTGSGAMPGTGNSGNNNGGSGGTATTTPATVTVEGIIVEHGTEVDLAQTGFSNTGAIITMRRLLQFNGCTDSSLNGGYGLVFQWNTATQTPGGGTTGTSTNVLPLLGRLVADGAGGIVRDTFAVQSPLQDLQTTGTYTVNNDCSGTAQLTDSSGAIHTLTFMLVQGERNTSGSPQPNVPELLFMVTDASATATGVGKHE